MNVMNPFGDGYSVAEMTAAINLLPRETGTLLRMGVFEPMRLRQRTVIIEEHQGTVAVLPFKPVNGGTTLAKRDKRRMINVSVPRIPYEDRIFASEISGVRQLGSTEVLMNTDQVVNDHQAKMRLNHDTTLEYHLIGALKGQLLDVDGSVEIDLFDAFGISETVFDFQLDDVNTDLQDKCQQVVDHVRTNMAGAIYSGVAVLASPGFMRQFRTHPKVEKAYERWLDGEYLRQSQNTPFNVYGVDFYYYDDQAPVNGVNTSFIGDGEALILPMGTRDTFKIGYSPADWWDTVNTEAEELYSRLKIEEESALLKTEQNPLPHCRRPRALGRLIAA